MTPNVVGTLPPAVNASLQRTGLTLYPIEGPKSPNPLGQPIWLLNYMNCEGTINLYPKHGKVQKLKPPYSFM
ncbi:hypothetical protein DRO69_05860 [Candidatus Bathyarchaeota archaeon]|nr:MAG: hypothetical protein DRO69_05860 [Candidatus Bathyarchaeota archaeon]